MAEAVNYKNTVLMPKTDFPMRAGLVQNEPKIQKHWADRNLYAQILEARKGRTPWILHDGPPYANGDIHIGHLLNKVLKDIVVKFRTMEGYLSPYIPGWDCHGLPIEHQVATTLGDKFQDISPLDFRKLCRQHAEKYVATQSKQFERLGVFGQFDNPYITMSPEYEAAALEVFAHLVGQGLVHKQLKPVHWCIECATALAEAELEYEDRQDTSIFVDFRVTAETRAAIAGDVPEDVPVSFMIWTTTPWTLPANMAVAVHVDFNYDLIEYEKDGQKRVSVIAAELVKYVMDQGGIADYRSLRSIPGRDLSGLTYDHPFVDRLCTVVTADYVALQDEKGTPAGTGLVHTAPGHGAEDYQTGLTNGIEIYSPVLGDGTFDDTVPEWLQGVSVWDGNKIVNQHLVESGHMFHLHDFMHSYPHCWRSKSPTIFRCTEQWFIAVDKPLIRTGKTLRQMAAESIRQTTWIPAWGQARIKGMLESRPDWCISRQRTWGLPIPAFYDSQDRVVLTPETVRRVADHFRQHGSDSWFTDSPRQILGTDCPLPEGVSVDDLTAEKDIFDVWFESGSSWYAVGSKEGWESPVDLYLEGSDQHRGWFQLSMLPGLGATGQAPFKSVLTHGFVNDEQGKKMSKSAGNIVDPQVEVAKYGADILRLWVASLDYRNDIRCSDTLIRTLQDEYRKIRNTIRFSLGTVSDFDPGKDAVEVARYGIDAWARAEQVKLIRDVREHYDKYEFYRVARRIHDFCAVQMSNIYFTAVKDRLYCDARNSARRRASQTVLKEIADALIRLITPILIHTSEEAWGHLLFRPEEVSSVHLAHLPEASLGKIDEEVLSDFEKILPLREQGMQELERLKNEADLKNPLDATAIYVVPKELADLLEKYGEDICDLLAVGYHEIRVEDGPPKVFIKDARSEYARCARSWKRRPDVGSDAEYPDLSARDAEVIRSLK